MNMLDRRTFLTGGTGTCAALAIFSPVLAQAMTFSRVTTDVARLRANGAGTYADLIRANLDASLRRQFAGRIGSGGPQLIVSIRSVQLTAFAGNGGGGRRFGGDGGGGTDYMDGEALVVSGRKVLRRHPQLLALPPSGAAWYLEDNERRRTAALCETYAQWLARAV